jgi:hypothetical protein
MSSLSVGIVGLPNVGKSTLFNALQKKQMAAVANFPFCTIEPNTGIVPVPDIRVDVLTKISKSEKKIYTTIEFTDIAGLVKGAHEGKGLGNQFLSHIREVDLIVEVVREFTQENVVHIEGRIDPEEDKEIINLELVMADLSTVEKRLETLKKKNRTGSDKLLTKTIATLEKAYNALNEEKALREVLWETEEIKILKEINPLTLKPLIYVVNIDENDIGKTQDLNDVLYLSAKTEAEIAILPEEESQEYLKEFNLNRTGLDKLIITAYRKLGLITFLTTGPDESRAWTVKQGTKAPQAAGVIHTDFEKAFIKAEIVDYNKLIQAGGFEKSREEGFMRLEGKDYVIKDGDVVYFRVQKS